MEFKWSGHQHLLPAGLHRRRTLVSEKEKLTQYEIDLSTVKDSLKKAGKRCPSTRKMCNKEETALQTLQFEVRQLNEEVKRTQRRMTTLEQDIRVVEEQEKTVSKRASAAKQERQQKEKKRGSLTDKIATLKTTISVLDKDLRFSQEQRSQQVQYAGECSKRRNEWNNQCTLLGERLIQTKQRHDTLVANRVALLKRKEGHEKEITNVSLQHTELLHTNRKFGRNRSLF